MPGVIDPAWKREVLERAASAVEPGQHAFARRLEQLELNPVTGPVAAG